MLEFTARARLVLAACLAYISLLIAAGLAYSLHTLATSLLSLL
jgi:hypothetical protein